MEKNDVKKYIDAIKTIKEQNIVIDKQRNALNYANKKIKTQEDLIEKKANDLSRNEISLLNEKHKKEIRDYCKKIHESDKKVRKLTKKNLKLEIEITSLNEKLADKDIEINKLKYELAKLQSKLNVDSTNSGIPTSQTPINKTKIIPNSRVKSDRNKGGQPNHEKAKLEKPNYIDEENIHTIDKCPKCDSDDLIDTGNTISKYVVDYKIIRYNTKHTFKVYKCSCCGKEVHEEIPLSLKEEVQYGNNVISQMLTLLNIGNVPINKVKRIIEGLSLDISPSEGFIAKIQKRAANGLSAFIDELKSKIVYQPIVYWDDTVITVDKNRACMRFYGADNLALYAAHEKKNKAGLDADAILSSIDKTQKVMHDHNKVNYNPEYEFFNIECCAHLIRDLKKVSQNLPNHKWTTNLENLLSSFNIKRKALIEKGLSSFTYEEFQDFMISMDNCLIQGIEENKQDRNVYYSEEELTLIKRITEYRDNYTYWIIDFNIPFTNNFSERSLRGIKSKMKVSGQFQNINRAEDYAKLRSYIETSHMNGINESVALTRLLNGSPYTVEEMIKNKEEKN